MSRWSRACLVLGVLALAMPAVARAEDAAEVSCKDGTKSKGGKGACSGHGGVDKSATPAKSGAGAGAAATTEPTSSTSNSSSTSKSKSATASSAATPAAAAETAEVTCKDGTKGKAGKGACSGHGGVDKGASPSASAGPAASAPAATEPAPSRPPAPVPAATSPGAVTPTSHAPATGGQKGPPTAKCKDGSFSYAQHHTGACSNHGGVAEWLDGTQK